MVADNLRNRGCDRNPALRHMVRPPEKARPLMHRLREAMRTGGLEPLGGRGKVVEADETYFGRAEEMHVSPQRKGRPYTKRGK